MQLRLRERASAVGKKLSTTVSTHLRNSNGLCSSLKVLESILVKSRISLIMLSKNSPDSVAVFTNFFCSGVSFDSSNMFKIPSTPFMGVRISCDMEAKKRLLIHWLVQLQNAHLLNPYSFSPTSSTYHRMLLQLLLIRPLTHH